MAVMCMSLSRTALVVVLLLLASVGTASAECAWVLWIESSWSTPEDPGGRGSWDINGAYPTFASCESGRAGKTAQLADSRRGIMRQRTGSGVENEKVEASSNVVSHSFTTAKGFFSFSDRLLCLPDTVDPRGPKMK